MGSRPRPPGCGTANSGRREPRPGPGGRRPSRAIHPEPGTAGPAECFRGDPSRRPGPDRRAARALGRMGLRLRRGAPGNGRAGGPGGDRPGGARPGGARPGGPAWESGPAWRAEPRPRPRLPWQDPRRSRQCAVTPRSGPTRPGGPDRQVEDPSRLAVLAGQRPVSAGRIGRSETQLARSARRRGRRPRPG